MDRCGFEHTVEKVIPESFYLHVFVADGAEINEHIQTDEELYDTSGMSVLLYIQKDPEGYGQSDIAEIKKIEQVVFRQPQGHCD